MSMDIINLYWTIKNKKAAYSAAFSLVIVLYWTSLDNELVEVAGFEPASEDIQHNGPTCVVNVLRFASAHAH